MDPLISVIIPVYNLESELAACLESVQAQTLPDWEAVCVDDGSRDDSLERLHAFAAEDARIRVLHQENAGVSAARNLGLENAKGRYVYFLDGDDVLHPQTFERMTDAMQSGPYDVVVSSYRRIYDQNEPSPPLSQTACRSMSDAAYFALDPGLVRAVWAKLFRRETALAARFPLNLSHSEDTHYVFQVLSAGARLGYLDAPLYGYYEREVSASRKLFTASNATSVLALRDVCEKLRDGPDDYLFGMAMKMLLQDVLLVRMHLSNDKQIVALCRQSGRAFLADWLRCRAVSLRTRLIYAATFLCPFLYALGRIAKDPTMLDFYLHKRKKNQESVS